LEGGFFAAGVFDAGFAGVLGFAGLCDTVDGYAGYEGIIGIAIIEGAVGRLIGMDIGA